MAIKGRHVAGLAGGALLLAGFLITGFEDPGGKPVLHVYPDPVSGSKPWTYCDGETQRPQAGHTYSLAECDAETAALIKKTDATVLACTRADLPDNARAAMDSLAWNIGTGAFCASSIASYARAGDLKTACDRFLLYSRAGGRVMPGLAFRRGEERTYCIKDVR